MKGKRQATRHGCATYGVDKQGGYPEIGMVAIEGCAITMEGTVTKMSGQGEDGHGVNTLKTLSAMAIDHLRKSTL